MPGIAWLFLKSLLIYLYNTFCVNFITDLYFGFMDLGSGAKIRDSGGGVMESLNSDRQPSAVTIMAAPTEQS